MDEWTKISISWAPVEAKKKILNFIQFCCQMFLVTGGWDGAEILDSTELFDPSLGTWTMGAKLPQPMSGMKAANINNRVLIFGK